MPTCGITQTIFGTECIGDSLAKINTNFNRLELAVCELSAKPPPQLQVNIQSGDGLSVFVDNDENVSEDNFIINANNSIQYIGVSQMSYPTTKPSSSFDNSYIVTKTVKSLADGSLTTVLNFGVPKTTPKPTPGPFVTFESVAMGNNPPAVTLYWNSNADLPFKLYSTNDNLVTNLLFTPAPKTNGHILTLATEGENSTSCFVGGYFSKVGAAVRSHFALLNLKDNASTVGTAGSLSSIPGNADPAVILNTTPRTISGKLYYAGFNRRVRVLKYFTYNNNKFLAVGGDFTGGNTLGFLGARLILFNLTTQQVYEFQLNNIVLDIMPYANFLFVCGQFTSGNAVNATGGDLALPCLFRINLNNLTNLDRNTWIDRNFQTEILNSFPTTRPGVYSANATYYIYKLAYYNNYLYCGGKQYAYAGDLKTVKNYGVTVHNIQTGKRVDDWTCVLYRSADAAPVVTSMYVETIFDNVDPTKPRRTVLYIGGMFTNINMIENRFRSVRGRPTTWTRKGGIAAFTLQTFDVNGVADADFSNRPQLEEWVAFIGGGYTYNILPETNSSASPLYIAGNFTVVNGVKVPYLAAITKPQGVAELATVQNWNMKLNGPVWTMVKVLSGSSMNVGITPPKTSLLIGGSFTKVMGIPKRYLARVSCVNQSVGSTPPSAVVWKLAGQAVTEGNSFSIIPDDTLVAGVTANPTDCLNVTKFPPLCGGFENFTKGDLCRFQITREDSLSPFKDTYYANVELVGISVDYNTSNVDLSEYTQVSTLTSTFDALSSVPEETE